MSTLLTTVADDHDQSSYAHADADECFIPVSVIRVSNYSIFTAEHDAYLSWLRRLLAMSRKSAGSSGEKKPLAISSMHCFNSMFFS